MSAPEEPRPSGETITFYSYKGGTGRTMALANVACLLAERARPKGQVLVMDWDLEAPGLHRFFPPRFESESGTDLGLDETKGLIDLFVALSEALPAEPVADEDEATAAVLAAIQRVDVSSFICDTAVPGVSIMRAGRNDDGKYSARVGTFDWEDLFRRVPNVYRALADKLASLFRYVLIDSRTGVTDISGICTSLMAEKLVVVFTPNRQSLSGVRDLVERATSYRRNSDDLRPLLVYPLPSRIEASLQDLRTLWRLGNRDKGVVGYEPMFQELFARAYGLERCDLSQYFDEVQIQQTPDYAYGEEIAVRRASDRFSLANSYRVFVARLLSGAPPWPKPPPLVEDQAGAEPASSTNPEVRVDDALPRPKTPGQDAAGLGSPPHAPSPASQPPPSAKASSSSEPLPKLTAGQIFISYAKADGGRVRPIVEDLRRRGLAVWMDDSAMEVGSNMRRAVEESLDASRAVVVFWSAAALSSRWVLTEAEEGLRRGVLVPVILEDVTPPLGFRALQAIDLRRDTEEGRGRLRAALGAMEGPAGLASPLPGEMAPSRSPKAPRSRGAWVAGGAVVLVAALTVFGLERNKSEQHHDVQTISVPDFAGVSTSEALRIAKALGQPVAFLDENGKAVLGSDGFVRNQEPAADEPLPKGKAIRLMVSSASASVPTLVGMTLDAALVAVGKAHLKIGTTDQRPIPDAKPATIVEQSPKPGTRAAEWTPVNLVVAVPPQDVKTLPFATMPSAEEYPASKVGRDALNAAIGELVAGQTKGRDYWKARSAVYRAASHQAFVPDRWAMSFVFWCFANTNPGVLSGERDLGYYVASFKRWAQGRRLFHARARAPAPRPGDLVLFAYKDGSAHIGIVHHVTKDTIYDIEGTIPLKDGGKGVAGATHPIDDAEVDGFVEFSDSASPHGVTAQGLRGPG